MEVTEVAHDSTATLAPLPGERPRLSNTLLHFSDRHRHALFAVVFALYLVGFNGQWRVERDSALYLSVAKNLATGHGYTYRGIPNHVAFPGLPLLFAATFKVFHSQSVVPPLVLMLLMGFAGLGLTYRLFLLHSGRPTAVVITVGLGMSRLFYRYAFELLTDMPFLVGVMAFLVGYEAVFFARERAGDPQRRTRWFDWVFLFGGLALAICMRPQMWVLLAAIVIAMAWRTRCGEIGRKPLILAILAIVAAAVLFWKIDPRHQGQTTVSGYEDYLLEFKFAQPKVLLAQIIHNNLPNLLESAGVKALFGAPFFVGLNTIASLVVIALSIWLLKHRVLWGIWAVMTVLMLCLFKPLDRYFLPVIPLLVFAWWQLMVRLNHRLPVRWGNWLFLLLLGIGGGTNLARLGEMLVREQRRTPFLEHYREGCYASLPKITDLLDAHMRQRDWVMVEPKCARILTYASGHYAVEQGDPVSLARATHPTFALEGFFDESRPAPGEPLNPSPLISELRQRGLKLGPVVGDPIQGPHDRRPWILHRVVQLD